MEFDWDEHNLFHIARHGVTRAQVESALRNNPIFIRDEVRQGEDRRNYVGRAGDAVILIVVVTARADKIRCVTAYPANRFFRNTFILRRGVAT